MELNKIIHADCMDVMKDIPDKYFELAIVDPPYGIERFKKGSLRFDKVGKYKKGLQWDSKPNQDYFQELFRVSQNQIIWGANNFILPPTEYFIIWNKQQTVDNFATCEYAWTNIKKPAKMFDYSIHLHNNISKIHPTQKPVALYKWLLHNYAKQGDKILDTHSGSGTTAMACIDMGFDYLCIEKDKDYFEASVKRIDKENIKLKMDL